MSRRPTSAKVPSISRTASSASLAMPPPGKNNMRPPSAMSTSSTAAKGSEEVSEEGPSSPSKKLARKIIGSSSGGGVHAKGRDGVEGGEINIQVVVRCRGRSSIELSQSSPIITNTSGALSKSITIETTPLTSSSLATFTTASTYGGSHAPSTKTYPFDKVLGPEADQTMVFREVAEGMLDEVLAGYNCTIFAYGQTGTGKTYTMQGDLELSPLSAPKDSAGIVPRVLHRLFSLLSASTYTEFSVKCSYVELYNEELRDLLAAEYQPIAAGQHQPMALGNGAAAGGLKLYEDGKKGVMIQGLEEVGVKSLKEALAILNKGCQRRQTAETKMNTESSRSHTIFSITVHVKETGLATGGDDLLKVGKFNLVDLAGSEAIGRSGATDKRAREAGMINQSLLTLGRVISALVEKGSHIPYRESKLTRLLQDSLGGRTKTCIVATVSPTRSNMEETLSTLDYAIRAKSIRNRPEINAHLTKTGLLKEYLGDIEKLKSEVLAAREKNGVYIPEDQWREMHEQQAKQKSDYEEAKLRASSCTIELATKKKEFDELSVKMLATTDELELAREAERELGVLMAQIKLELEAKRVALEEEMVVSEAYQKGEQRLDQVAGGLKAIATESISDVGGLFDKLARKAKVLGSNADGATRFGANMQGLSNDLRVGLQQLNSVQGAFGRELQAELEVYGRRGLEESQRDMASLEASFTAFNAMAKHFAKSIEHGQSSALQASASLLAMKDEVQVSVRDWASGVSEKSTRMVEDLLEHQQEHLSMVGSVLDSTADLVDAVISTARDHLTSEAQSSVRARQLTSDTATSEISRLRHQNILLTKLLQEEKANTSKLRTNLVNNLTSMIVSFTDAQDASWSEAVAQVQSANDAGTLEMQRFAEVSKELFTASTGRANACMGELDMGAQTSVTQRDAGREALQSVKSGLKSRLDDYGRETVKGAGEHVEVVDGFCGRMGLAADDVERQASTRAKEQSKLLQSMSRNTGETHTSSRTRTTTVAAGINSFSKTLLNSHASSLKTFNETHSTTTSSLASLIDHTESFLVSGIQEDLPTGITPKKRVWSVEPSWERTEPREVLIASLRQRAIRIEHAVPPDTESTEKGELLTRTTSTDRLGDLELPRDVSELASSQMGKKGKVVSPPVSVSVPVPVLMGKKGFGYNGVGVGNVQEIRPALTVLGEGGGNVPRRSKR